MRRSPVNSQHKGQWCETLMFSLICACTNGWVNNQDACDLRRHRANYDVIVMIQIHQRTIHPMNGWRRVCGERSAKRLDDCFVIVIRSPYLISPTNYITVSTMLFSSAEMRHQENPSGELLSWCKTPRLFNLLAITQEMSNLWIHLNSLCHHNVVPSSIIREQIE